MKLYTIGFTQKNAKEFFELIKNNGIQILVDIRLNNKSQLAGFTKADDLPYFLSEICSCKYLHCVGYAPTAEILDGYKKKVFTWDKYVVDYTALMQKRKSAEDFIKRFASYDKVCLLCSEPTPEYCHRRLFAEMVNSIDHNIEVIHL